MSDTKIPVQFIKCTEEDIRKMNSKKEQLENSIEEPEENSVMIPAGSQEQMENSI